MLQNIPQLTSYNPNFKGVVVKFANAREACEDLAKSGLELAGVDNIGSTFPMAVDDILLPVIANNTRKTINSDKEFKGLLEIEDNQVLFVAKQEVEKNIKQILDKAKIFANYIKNL